MAYLKKSDSVGLIQMVVEVLLSVKMMVKTLTITFLSVKMIVKTLTITLLSVKMIVKITINYEATNSI